VSSDAAAARHAVALPAAPPAVAPQAATPATVAPQAATPATAVTSAAVPIADPKPSGAARSAPTPAPAAAAAGRSALQAAMSKLGRPYRYGASGPSAFDCSGLVYWSYRQVGVTLPRTSSAMSRVGSPVSRNALQPGDLVFFYRPVSHVGIYVGNGQILHASTSGQPVKISPIGRMPFNSARRI
jgi:cell wall-associated NlpC family hydrolase